MIKQKVLMIYLQPHHHYNNYVFGNNYEVTGSSGKWCKGGVETQTQSKSFSPSFLFGVII